MNAKRWHSRTVMAVVTAGIAAANTACASAGHNPGLATYTNSKVITLQVDNRNWQDMRVYAVREGGVHPIRVATVTGGTSARVRIRQPLHGQVRFLLRPVGSRTGYTTEAVMVAAGQTLDLRVGSQLYLTQLLAW